MSPPTVYKSSPFFKFSPTVVTVFDNSLSNRCKLIYHCGFDLHFLDNWASLVVQLVSRTEGGSPFSAGDLGLISGLGRFPGEGNDYPLQYSGLENSMNCIVHGVPESQTH